MNIDISYYPGQGYNQYIILQQGIWKSFGKIYPISNIKGLLYSLLCSKRDLIILNWVENMGMNKFGKVTIFSRTKFYIFISLVKCLYRKCVYVKHNNYPHDIKDIKSGTYFVEYLVKKSDLSIVHDPSLASDKLRYVPHPLYASTEKTSCEIVKKFGVKPYKYYLILSRLDRKRGLEKIIKKFPNNKNLVIAGYLKDKKKVEYFKSLSRHNIKVIPKLLTVVDTESLIKHSLGLISYWESKSMIVSGVIVNAISNYVKIFCSQNSFTLWLKAKLGSNNIIVSNSISELCNNIDLNSGTIDYSKKKVENIFSNKVISKAYLNILKDIKIIKDK